MRRGARAAFEPRPFCSSSDARAAVMPVHRNARSDAVLSRSSVLHTLVHSNPPCSRSRCSFWYLSLSLSLCFSAGLLALTVFIHVCLLFYFHLIFIMILFFAASFSYCMAETRSCNAETHSSQDHSPRLPDAPSTSGTPCLLNHSPWLPCHFHPNSSLAFCCSSFRESMLSRLGFGRTTYTQPIVDTA